LIFTSKSSQEDLRQFAECIRTHIANTKIVIEKDVSEFSITASFGVVVGYDKNINTVIEQAVIVLYKAKSSGKNRVCFK